ncbi:aldehyde ferredoxin oxidoreductase family protein [Methanolobus vulcani]|uniref:Aldehyde ferredoxin oxidoreductase family protein n=1 Tax=Methanolobus vulcani TaxID=38026 RepID=A0A7Z8KQM1_9EURY|nr:aldehyde ferredoxin oxidoreductase family protein [Methanolobus vulcani]TQD28307.1 aldehyde ferredoxin oxidoreductase family protein [Methanolobus vulcani]
MDGWTGRTVIIDLGKNSVTETKTKKKYAEQFIGGRGLGCRLMQDFADPELDPLSPENPLILTTGPLTGTSIPMSGHFSITSKSPLTSTIFSTNVGGHFGAELKFAGIDALVILGKAEKPVYISIYDEEVEILSAGHLRGKNTAKTTTLLEDKGKVACIGRAGETLVSMANIVNDRIYTSGRGGHGAVAGSKNLKAIVVKGTNKIEIAKPDEFEMLVEKENKLLIASPPASKGLKIYGNSVITDLLDYMGTMPAMNFREKKFPNAYKLSGEELNNTNVLKEAPCYSCPIGCKRIHPDGRPVPDYDSIWAFGPNIGNDDIEFVKELDRLCLDYGLDPISVGSSIASYMEIKPGITMEEVKEIAIEIGEGTHNLCKGSHDYLSSTGKEECDTTVKGLDIPGYDPREIKGMSIAYTTSNTGGSHLSAFMVGPEIMGKPMLLERDKFDGKAALVLYFQNLTAVIDSLVMCPFTMLAIGEVDFASMLNKVTGENYSAEELLRAGERIFNMERMFNLKAGITSKDDTLPDRFFENGGIDKNEFEKTILDYYHFRGWTVEGIPEEDKLKELDIDEGKCEIECSAG